MSGSGHKMKMKKGIIFCWVGLLRTNDASVSTTVPLNWNCQELCFEHFWLVHKTHQVERARYPNRHSQPKPSSNKTQGVVTKERLLHPQIPEDQDLEPKSLINRLLSLLPRVLAHGAVAKVGRIRYTAVEADRALVPRVDLGLDRLLAHNDPTTVPIVIKLHVLVTVVSKPVQHREETGDGTARGAAMLADDELLSDFTSAINTIHTPNRHLVHGVLLARRRIGVGRYLD